MVSREVLLATYGLTQWYGAPSLMPTSHRHNDIEVNFIERGSFTYLFRGQSITLSAGELGVFWAALPHRVTTIEDDTLYYWLTVPLPQFLSWRMESAFSQNVLQGELIVDHSRQHSVLNLELFRRWQVALTSPDAELRSIVNLEIEACLKRHSYQCRQQVNQTRLPKHINPHQDKLHDKYSENKHNENKPDAMLRYIAAHYQDSMRIKDIADEVGLHPTYATALFHEQYGQTLIGCLNQYRVIHAQRLLITSDAPISDIALDSGFNSLSRFYVAFEEHCGQSPHQYRQMLRGMV